MYNQKQITKHAVKLILLILVVFSLAMQGCAKAGGKTYSPNEVRVAQTVVYGTIVGISEVQVKEDSSLLGPAVGGVTGGVLGSLIGGGSGSTLFAVGGALTGMVLGGATEYGARSYTANELTVQLEDGRTIVIVQAEDEYFVTGDSVRVLDMGDGSMRVQHR